MRRFPQDLTFSDRRSLDVPTLGRDRLILVQLQRSGLTNVPKIVRYFESRFEIQQKHHDSNAQEYKHLEFA